MFAHRDRSDYRCMNDRLLFEEARYNPNAELAIVLAERWQEEKLRLDEERTSAAKEDWMLGARV